MSLRPRHIAIAVYRSFTAIIPFLLLYGCAATVDEMAGTAGNAAARAAVPAAAQGLDEAKKPENQKKLVEFADSPAVKDSARLISQSVGEGATQGVIDSLVKLDSATIHHFVNDQLITPMVQALARQADQSVDDVLNDSNQKKMQGLIHTLMQEQIIPTIRQLLSDSAADAIKLSASADVQPAVTSNARTVSMAAIAGPRDALIQLGVLSDNGRTTLPVLIAMWSLIALGLLLAATLITAILALSRMAFAPRRSRRG